MESIKYKNDTAHGTKYEYFPYIEGGTNGKKLYIVNLYGDKLVITDKISESICFIDKHQIDELINKMEMKIPIYFDEIPMKEKYFGFVSLSQVVVIKVYYHHELNIDLDYIKNNIMNEYIFMIDDIYEIEKYEKENIDAYITINNKGEINTD